MTATDAHLGRLALAEPSASGELEREIDLPGVRRAAGDLLRALGADLDADGLQDTPRRMADAYAELLSPRPFTPTTFPNDDGYDQLIVAGAIPFHSLCRHHLLPFHGVAHVGYLPGERIVGLSKLARVVELFARSLQVQGEIEERRRQIAELEETAEEVEEELDEAEDARTEARTSLRKAEQAREQAETALDRLRKKR